MYNLKRRLRPALVRGRHPRGAMAAVPAPRGSTSPATCSPVVGCAALCHKPNKPSKPNKPNICPRSVDVLIRSTTLGRMRYSHEVIETTEGRHWRIRDEHDNRVATCWSEENAERVVYALNFAAGEPALWSCGHTAGACCAECRQELAVRAHELAEELFEAEARSTRSRSIDRQQEAVKQLERWRKGSLAVDKRKE